MSEKSKVSENEKKKEQLCLIFLNKRAGKSLIYSSKSFAQLAKNSLMTLNMYDLDLDYHLPARLVFIHAISQH